MNIALIVGLFALLLALIIGYNVIIQYRSRIESAKKQEAAKHIAVIETTEELMGNAHHLPYSKELLVCLNQRVLDALQAMYDIDPTNRTLAQRIANMEEQLRQLKENYAGGESTNLKVPSNDKQAIMMLKLVKRLRDTLRSEHKKGRVNTQVFVAENARLESIQVRINIENVVKRANDAITRGQVGTAKQLLKKGIDALSTKNDGYSNKARARLQSMLDEIDNKKKQQHDEERKQHQDKHKDDDIDVLFQPKKKW
ncbi:DNA repair protein [Vibrio sp. Of7-15]|uniref:DNA repair protein n=1 Tax=Vibrio sp. Of7-15 TaxID=2724879 RepID=UPI001EF27E2D|nr:DNA repair protein [Vibrio sp. Of7-15]MCG7496082.1 DNA repair protein [Vibrio sp. Of7-15]